MSDWWQSMMQYLSELGAGLWLKSAVALLIGGFMSLFDMAHPSIRPLVYLMLIDFALGAAHAIKLARFSWGGIRRGVAKFLFYALAFIVTSLADWGLDTDLFGVAPLTWSLCVYLISCEALSCLRHLAVFGGPKLPPWLFERLEYLKDSAENPHRRRDDWRDRPDRHHPTQSEKEDDEPDRP